MRMGLKKWETEIGGKPEQKLEGESEEESDLEEPEQEIEQVPASPNQNQRKIS
jgi:hypothetical protein